MRGLYEELVFFVICVPDLEFYIKFIGFWRVIHKIIIQLFILPKIHSSKVDLIHLNSLLIDQKREIFHACGRNINTSQNCLTSAFYIDFSSKNTRIDRSILDRHKLSFLRFKGELMWVYCELCRHFIGLEVYRILNNTFVLKKNLFDFFCSCLHESKIYERLEDYDWIRRISMHR